MKKTIIIALALFASLCTSAQTTYTRNGNTFAAVQTHRRQDVRANADSTKYTFECSDKKVRNIWIARTGSCFVIRRSKTKGTEYRQYCPREVSAAICKEIGREYKPSNK